MKTSWMRQGVGTMALGLLVLAASTAAAEQPVAESVSVVAIEVEVHVTKDGKPVRGLTADQFVGSPRGGPPVWWMVNHLVQ